MADDIVYKHTLSTTPYTIDFTRLLPNDTTLGTTGAGSDIIKVIKSDGTTVATTSVIDTLTFSGMTMVVPLKAGTDGEDYRIEAKGIGVQTTKPATFILEMRVRNSLLGAR